MLPVGRTLVGLVVAWLSAAELLAQSHPVLFVDATREARYAQMKADYDANPSSPATYGGRFYKYIKATADGGGDYFSQAIMYHITGNSSYATAAYNSAGIQWWLSQAETVSGICGNRSSDEWTFRVWLYDWIYPGLSSGQRSAFLAKLNATATTCLKSSDPRLNDSDQTIGDFFGGAMLYEATKDYNSTIVTVWETDSASRLIGGYTSVADNIDDRRNAVRYIFERVAAGGIGVDGSGYNIHNLTQPIMGYTAVNEAEGTDRFPEITAWMEDAPLGWAHSLSPNSMMLYQWGDEQNTNPRHFSSYYYIDTAMCMAGVSGDADIQDHVLDLIDSKGGFAPSSNGNGFAANGANPWLRCFTIWNPYATRGNKDNLSLHFYADGMGLVSERTAWSSGATWFSAMLGHRDMLFGEGWSHAGRLFGEFQLWKNGKWALTHPIAYDGPTTDARYAGGVSYPTSIGAIGSQEYRSSKVVTSGSDFTYASAVQGGSGLWNNYFGVPPTTLMEDTRSIVWLKDVDVVVVHSRSNSDDPRPCAAGWGNDAKVWCADRPTLKQLNIHSLTLPTITSNRADWEYSSGEYVRVTQLLPGDADLAVVNEVTELPTFSWYRGAYNVSELKYHIAVTPGEDRKWDTFLTTYDVHTGTPRAVTLVQDTGNGADAVLVAAASTNYLVTFNAIQGPDVPQPQMVGDRGWFFIEPHRAQVAAVLDNVRERTTGFTLAFNDGGKATRLILTHLDPGESWSYTVNGGGSNALTVDSAGVASATIGITGAISLAVIADDVIPVVIETATLPNGVKDVAYSQALTVSGGIGGPYTCSKTVGSFPTGISLSTCTIQGTPTVAEAQTFTIQACDGDSPQTCGSRAFTLTIVDTPTITTTNMDAGVVGSAYSDSCTTTGGTPPYTYTVDPATPCPGLSLNASNCAITGTPTTVGVCEFTVTVMDDDDATDDQELSISIAAVASAAPTVWIEEQGYRAIAHYRHPGLAISTSCTADLYNEHSLVTPIDSSTQSTGAARRYAVFTNLDPHIQYHVIVQCTTTEASIPVYFNMPEAPTSGEKTVPIQMVRPAVLGSAARVTLDWAYDAAMSDVTSVQNTSCGTSCTVTMTFPNQSIYYYRWRWQDASNNVLATSAVQPIVVQ